MRKNLFEVSEEEKKRIIESHINATNKQYLTENNQETTYPKKVIESLAKIKSSKVKIFEDGGCWHTYWIDSVYPLQQKLMVTACKGSETPEGKYQGWLSIRETSNWESVEGDWIYNPKNDYVTLKILGKTISDKYRPSTPSSEGSLFRNTFCTFISYNQIYDWKFWTDWSWNADDLSALYGEYQGCGLNLPEKLNNMVGSGFWDKFIDLLPGDW
jgi:hypothetical protein